MTQISQPDVRVNIVAANTTVANTAQKVLFVGQQLPAGSAVSGELQSNIQNDNSWDTLFGESSMLAGMLRDARKLNSAVRFDAIGLDDDGSAANAVGAFALSGTATEDGTLDFIIGSKVNHTLSIAVASGDTATAIGDNLVIAITADTKIPVTGSNTTGSVAITADNGGTVGNSITLDFVGSVNGITNATTVMSSGATDPTLTGVFDVVGDERYQTVVWPYATSLTELKSFLDSRFNSPNSVLDGIGITSAFDTLSNLSALLNAENSQSVAINVNKLVSQTNYKGSSLLELGYSISSQFAAIRSLRLEAGADISQFVITRNGARDSFGGPALASKPYFNTPFPNLPQTDIAVGFTSVEIETLQDNGGFVIGNNTAGNTTIAGEVITTYKTDTSGNPDVSFKYMNYVDTISNIREYYFNNLKARFAQSRLTSGDLVRGRDLANQVLIEAYCTQLYTDLSGEDFVLTSSGEQDLQFFIRNLVVTLSLDTGSVNVTMVTPIVTQLRTILATVQIAFSVNS